MTTIAFTGTFDKYSPINSEPHYVFKTGTTYLISCKDYPALISKLSPSDIIDIQGEVSGQCRDGIKLVNVKFGERK